MSKTNNSLKSKEYSIRDSPLTTMFMSHHMKSAFNMALSGVICLCAMTILNYLSDYQQFSQDLHFLTWAFGKPHLFLLAWTFIQICTIKIYFPLTICWLENKSNGKTTLASDLIYVFKLIIFICLLFAFSINVVQKYDFSPVMTFSLMAEKLRILMKIYSFSAENARKVNSSADANGKSSFVAPSLPQFIYFMFAPTLLYKDHYPRCQGTNWKLVLSFAAQFILTIFCIFATIQRFIVPVFSRVGLEAIPFSRLVYVFFICFILGQVFVMLLFYGFLHCWLNAWAELLEFGDRLFYEDWWNSTSYSQYYRKWNVPVHDWIHTYVYTGIVQATKKRGLAALTVFLTSAAMHEYVIALSLGFFCPVMMSLYACLGVVFFFIPKNMIAFRPQSHYGGNFFFFFTMFVGWSVMIMLYSIEWYSRKNCPIPNETLLEAWFLPRTPSCLIVSF